MNNRIITRIAAFIDNNGNKNTEIDQSISNKNFIDIINSQRLVFTISPSNNIVDNIQMFDEYTIINNIGLVGISFFNKKKEKIIMEFQVGQLTSNSIMKMNNYINDQLNFLSYQDQKILIEQADNKITNRYYCGIFLIYKNYLLTKSVLKFYSRDRSITQLQQNGYRLINQYKNKYAY